MDKIPMTIGGHKALTEEFRRRTSEDRPAIIAAISEARAHGDLSENAEYHAAKEEQGHLEAKLAEMEAKLAGARLLDESQLDLSKANILSTVEVLNKKMNKTQKFTLVSEAEANLKEGKLSVTSPIGKALLGKAVGEVGKAQTPAGLIEFEILKITM